MKGAVSKFWRELRYWLRPPRRLRFTRVGAGFTGGTLVIGFAAINTGNNLLYLLLGGSLGFIALSGWLSEQTLRGITIRRRVPRGATVGVATRIVYEATNGKKRLPSLALEVVEPELGGARTFIADVPPGRVGTGRLEMIFHRRGRYVLESLGLATSFPFGFFTKSREAAVGGAFLVWPRHDLPVREPRAAGLRARRRGTTATAAAGGGRGDFRGLREYRSGDDPRDVHWPSTARVGEPVVREYERDEADVVWICLDQRMEPGDHAERVVEIAASLAARAARDGARFGLATAETIVPAGTGPAQLERVLDALAVATFGAGQPATPLPSIPESCIQVTGGAMLDPRFGGRYTVE